MISSSMSFTAISFIVWLAVFCASVSSCAQSSKIIEGTYNFSGNPSGSVDQHVTIEVKGSGETFDVSMSVVWEPGVIIEVDSPAMRSSASSNILNMNFTDNFGNCCKGKLIFEIDHVEVSIEAITVTESRAARQYGFYKLIKEKRGQGAKN